MASHCIALTTPRELAKREGGPKNCSRAPAPAALKMIHEGCNLVLAAQASGLRPDTLRRWLHRPELVGLIRRERAAFRQAICAGNEHALMQIRDEPGGNAMAKVNSIKCLEDMNEEGSLRRSSDVPSPGVTIRIVNVTPQPVFGNVTPAPTNIALKPQIIDGSQ